MAKHKDVERDMGDGFYIFTEYHGSAAWYCAMQLDAPGGYVMNGRSKRFGYARVALAQIEKWRLEDGIQSHEPAVAATAP